MKKILLVLTLMFAVLPTFAIATTSEEYYAAGLAVFKDKDYERAVKYFRAAVEQKADYWEAYHSMGISYLYMGNRTEALVAMRKSLGLHSNNPELRKFMEWAEDASPWVSSTSWQAKLPIISLVMSLLALGLTGFTSYKLGVFKAVTFKNPFSKKS